MTRLTGILAAALLAMTSAAAPCQDGTYVPGQLLIRFRPEFQGAAAFLMERGLETVLDLDLLRVRLVEIPATDTVERWVAEMSGDPRVEFAHPNYYGTRASNPGLPNDPQFGFSWGLNNTGQMISSVVGVTDADIDAPEGWCLQSDASAVVIAIVDSGANMAHQDLGGTFWVNPLETMNGIDDDGNGLIDDINGWDFFDNDATPDDLDGHGTNVTGIVAMRGNNNIGSSGVCQVCRVMLLKDGNAAPTVAFSAAGLQYAAAKGVAVVNFSSTFPASAAPTITVALDACRTADVVVVAAAGNTGGSIEGGALDVPAELTHDNLLVVASSNNLDQRAWFTSYGVTSVDIGVPGADLYTTTRTNGFGFVNGTSFSAPLATGCVALVRSRNGGVTAQQAIGFVLAGGDPILAFNGFTVSGRRLNLNGALQATPLGGPEYQVNQPSASLLVNGLAGTASQPAVVTRPVGLPVPILFGSTLGGGAWDLGFGVAPLVPRSGGALVAADGQVINLDLADPTQGTWFGQLQTSPPFSSFGAQVTFSLPVSLSAQMALATPSTISGLALSQPVRLVIQ